MGDDAAIDAAIANGSVPDYLSADYLKENRITSSTVGIALMVAAACTVIAGRLLSRKFVIKRFGLGLDDGIALLSLLTFIPFAALCIVLVQWGAARHVSYFRYVLDRRLGERFQIFDSIAHLLYLTALMLCRVSGLAFYYRVCSLHREFLIGIKIVFGVLMLGYVAQMGLIIFHCTPVTLRWDPNSPDDTSMNNCLQWGPVYITSSIVSLICDFLLFGIPVAMLWALEMPQKRKIQLACILLPGVGVVGLSVARVIELYLHGWETDESPTFTFLSIILIEVAEVAATIIALSVPGTKPLFDRYILRKKDSFCPSRGSYMSGESQSDASDGSEPSEFQSRGYGNTGANSSRRGDVKREDIYVTVDFSVLAEKHG